MTEPITMPLPAYTCDRFTLFDGSPQDVLAALPARIGAMALTIAPLLGTDVTQLNSIAGELLRVVAGPVVVLTPVYATNWAEAFKQRNVSIHRTVYFDTLDVIVANGDNLDIPTDPASLNEAINGIVEQETGSLIDVFASSWMVALPTILARLRYVGVASGAAAGATPKSIAQTINRKLAGCERRDRNRKQTRSGMNFRIGRKA